MALFDGETTSRFAEWLLRSVDDFSLLRLVAESSTPPGGGSGAEISFSVVGADGEEREAEVDPVVTPGRYLQTVVGVDVAQNGDATAVSVLRDENGNLVASMPVEVQSLPFNVGRSEFSEEEFRREYLAEPAADYARGRAEAAFRGREFLVHPRDESERAALRSRVAIFFDEAAAIPDDAWIVCPGLAEAYGGSSRHSVSPRYAELQQATEKFVGPEARVEPGRASSRAAQELKAHGERLGRGYSGPLWNPTTLSAIAVVVPSEIVDEFVALEAALAATVDLAAKREATPEK